ncbi:MAG: hypothetical protein ABL974_15090 [Prosthecobacter sp.]
MSTIKQTEECVVTVRLPKELAEFLDDVAESACNTRAGIVKLAVKSFRESLSKAATPTEGAGRETAVAA